MNLDLVYVGNCSNDNFVSNNSNINVLGGSTIYSSFSSRECYDGKIGVICNINENIRKILEQKNITHFGNIVEKTTEFLINESEKTCVGKYYCPEKINIKDKLNIKHLHISFRQGVDVESILNNKNIVYDNLSIDVMIHSVKDMIPIINKYKSKMNIIFCNMDEYFILKEYVSDIPIKIITNEDKPVVLINRNEIKSFDIKSISKIVSSIGAGDTFIGGFLGKYLSTSDFNISINKGILNSNKKLSYYGPIMSKVDSNFENKEKIIPNNIIVIGNSCAGKSTFINEFKKNYNIYQDIDDLNPLLEMFKIDDILYNGNKEKFYKFKNTIKYMNEQWEEYYKNFDDIKHYTMPSKDGKGHEIIRPILWDYIISNSLSDCKEFNIIQFSRGRDSCYEKEFKENSYYRCLKEIVKKIPQPSNTIIINLTSSLSLRKERNIKRFNEGGHFVSEDTMNYVYCDDIFEYNYLDKNKGYIMIGGTTLPVYCIDNNKNLSKLEIEKFMVYNINEIIKYYNMFKEEYLYGIKSNSKRYLAK